MTPLRAVFIVLLLSGAAYANSLGNGFAYDDTAVITLNPLVGAGDWRGALTSPYHPDALEGAGLYRPVTSFSFTMEWLAFGGDPWGFHLLNLVVHSLVSLLVLFFLLQVGSLFPALAGAAVFALHPVHTEAVANVVGRAELYSALFFSACVLYWKGWSLSGWKRSVRLVALGGLYLLSLGSKEIGVTLPLVLVLLELFRPQLTESRGSFPGSGVGSMPDPRLGWVAREQEGPTFLNRMWGEAPTYVLLAAVLLAYLGLRGMVLGTLTGEVSAPVLQALGPGGRVLTAISLWPQYVRLLVFPLDLAADYAPGVLFPAEGPDLGVVLGCLVLFGLGFLAVRSLRAVPSIPMVALGILWVFLVLLPVSNLLFPTGVLLAERTLYLPSVGFSLLVAALVGWFSTGTRRKRAIGLTLGVLVGLGFFLRTVLRNPAWQNTYVVLETLNQEHPESHLAFLNRGIGLERVGDLAGARREFTMAHRLAPLRYGTLTAVAGFLGRAGDWGEAEVLLRQAMEIAPSRDDAYRLLSAQLLRQGRGREAHGVALGGIARAGFHPDLWGAVSESYVLKGDLDAALRARRVALTQDPAAAQHWARLADLLEARGELPEAGVARAKATSLGFQPPDSREPNFTGPQGRTDTTGPGQGDAAGTGQTDSTGTEGGSA